MADVRPSDDQIRADLARIVAEPELARSPQLVDFITYVVEQTLAGEESRLKAYTIATEVLGRGADFDPQRDASVRVQANRLRKALSQIYARRPEHVTIRISLPVGRYAPQFDFVNESQDSGNYSKRFEASKNRSAPVYPVVKRRGSAPIVGSVLLSAALATLALIFVALPWIFPPAIGEGEQRTRPVVVVAGIEAGQLSALVDAGVLTNLIADRLAAFSQLDVRLGSAGASASLNGQPGVYRLGGTLFIENGRIDLRAVLSKQASGEVIWTFPVQRAQTAADPGSNNDLGAIADSVAANIGSPRGPVHVDMRAVLPESAFSGPGVSDYGCWLLYRDALGPDRAEETGLARHCLLTRLASNQDSVIVRAQLASLDAADAMRIKGLDGTLADRLRAQVTVAEQAVRRSPGSSFAHELFGQILEAVGDRARANLQYRAALEDNPANADALARLATMLAFEGDPAGLELVDLAIHLTAWPANWYFAPRSLFRLVSGAYLAAMKDAEIILNDDAEIGLAVMVAAATGVGQDDVRDRYLPELLRQPGFLAQGIMPRLSARISDQTILDAVRVGLTHAGVVEARLNGPYDFTN